MATPASSKTELTAQEKQWILASRFTRLTDNEEILIYPMGAERYLASALNGDYPERYPIINQIKNKHVLVVPGYSTSSFLFAQAGAKSVCAYDKDPVTIAYMKAIKIFYNYRQYDKNNKPYPSVGELLTALTQWYPPLLKLPHKMITNTLFFFLYPKALRRAYIFYMLRLIREAIEKNLKNNFELECTIKFHAKEVDAASNIKYDTAYVPYLLGVKNGVEHKEMIVAFIKELMVLVPEGGIIVTPTRNTKEFGVIGQSYFSTTQLEYLTDAPELKNFCVFEDREWFKTQGLAVFAKPKKP